MSVRMRGTRWVAQVYDPARGSKVWVGTFGTEEDAREAEQVPRPTPPPDWSLEAKGERECRNCGRPAEHLHHIVPRGVGPATVEFTTPAFNGLPLCALCHAGWHRGSVRIDHAKLLPEERAFVAGAEGLGWLQKHYFGDGPLDIDAELRDEVVALRVENKELRRAIASTFPQPEPNGGGHTKRGAA